MKLVECDQGAAFWPINRTGEGEGEGEGELPRGRGGGWLSA